VDADYVLHLPWRRPPISANDRWPHYTVKAKIEKEVKLAAWALARRAKVPALDAILVELVWYPGTNRRVDGDNAAPTLKYLIDGLVQAGVLPDDNSERVLRSSCRAVLRRNDPWNKADPRLILAITDASALAPLPHYAPEE
jgi:hypothetical protein